MTRSDSDSRIHESKSRRSGNWGRSRLRQVTLVRHNLNDDAKTGWLTRNIKALTKIKRNGATKVIPWRQIAQNVTSTVKQFPETVR